ncbi:MAG TPA: GNAT family N-acetyltransferase [Actinomycetes bacterium]|nr:GNAT family N-acetyltransferase [Actinomycetes bacterium]
MEIRPVRRGEAAGLRELRLRALGDAPYAYFASLENEESLPLSYWEDWATSEDKVVLVAVEDGDWLGMAGAFVHPDKSDTVSLWWLWVAPNARGRGLARRLVVARADWARERGAVRLELAVAENNRAAKALYRSLGFVPTGERRSMASDPTRVGIFMARPL